MSTVDFVVVGFPKCGTTALMRLVEKVPHVIVDRRNGSLEAPFYTTKAGVAELERLHEEAGDRWNGHKFTAYIYNWRALKRLAAENPRPLFIVCVRDPMRSLVSWREMHRKLAVTETKHGHFVNETEETRIFYQTASLDDYYDRFAKPRLDYARHIRRMLKATDDAQTMIIAQEYLAVNPGSVVHEFLTILGVDTDHVTPPPSDANPHVGFADKVEEFPGSADLAAAVTLQREALQALLRELSSRKNVTILA